MAKKQAEKEEVYAVIDETAKEVLSDPAKLQGFLDTQSRMDRYSAANALLIFKQYPSATQLKSWIEETSGIAVDSLNKKAMGEVRASTDGCGEVQEMLDIRQRLAKTSTEKYNAMLRTACPDGRIRGLTQFCGAARTGRWAGRLVQMQNLSLIHI